MQKAVLFSWSKRMFLQRMSHCLQWCNLRYFGLLWYSKVAKTKWPEGLWIILLIGFLVCRDIGTRPYVFEWNRFGCLFLQSKGKLVSSGLWTQESQYSILCQMTQDWWLSIAFQTHQYQPQWPILTKEGHLKCIGVPQALPLEHPPAAPGPTPLPSQSEPVLMIFQSDCNW